MVRFFLIYLHFSKVVSCRFEDTSFASVPLETEDGGSKMADSEIKAFSSKTSEDWTWTNANLDLILFIYWYVAFQFLMYRLHVLKSTVGPIIHNFSSQFHRDEVHCEECWIVGTAALRLLCLFDLGLETTENKVSFFETGFIMWPIEIAFHTLVLPYAPLFHWWQSLTNSSISQARNTTGMGLEVFLFWPVPWTLWPDCRLLDTDGPWAELFRVRRIDLTDRLSTRYATLLHYCSLHWRAAMTLPL